MTARSIQRRTRGSLSTRFVIVLMAVALLISFAPLTGNNAAARDSNPQPIKPVTTVLSPNTFTVAQANETTPEDDDDGPNGFVVVPLNPTPVPEIDDFTAETPEPTVEIDDFVAVTPEPTEEIDDFTTAEEDEVGSIELHKWECEEDFVGADWADYSANCTQVMNDVEFNASLGGIDLGAKLTGADGDGTVIWQTQGGGELVIAESIPAGYLDPIIYCGFTFTFQTDAGLAIADGLVFPDSMVGGVLIKDFHNGELLYCDVFNRPSNEPGSITVVKHTCAPGYDVTAIEANPWLDCPNLTNGVTFTAQGFEYWAQSNTGDSMNGQAYFGGLIPGIYGVTETLPFDTAYAFSYECFDTNGAVVAPTTLIQLENGTTLYVDLQPGQNLVCHWMNVPNLHGGTLVITKYWCDGAVYSIWSCDLYEFGASFNVYGGPGPIQVTTGADGQVVMFLDPGTYELDGFPWSGASPKPAMSIGRGTSWWLMARRPTSTSSTAASVRTKRRRTPANSRTRG
jgi:hypothetical protein